MQELLVGRALADGVGSLVAHVTCLLDQLVRHNLLEGGRARGIALGRAHLVRGLLLAILGHTHARSDVHIGTLIAGSTSNFGDARRHFRS